MPRTTKLEVATFQDNEATKPGRKALGFAIGIGLIATIVFLVLLGELPRQQQGADWWVDHTLEVLIVATNLDADLATSVSEARGFMIDKQPDASLRFDAATLQVSADLANLRLLTADNPVQQSTLTRLEPIIASLTGLLRDGMTRLDAGDAVNDPTLVANRQTGQALAKQIYESATQLEAEERRLLTERHAIASHISRFWLGVSLGCGVLASASGFFAVALLVDYTRKQKHLIELNRLNIGLEDRVRARNAEIALKVEALERSNRELDDFAYIASHDLKEPLRGLFNNAKFLREDYADKLDDQGIRRLSRLGFLCQRMEQLINDLLYFSRLGSQDLAIQPTDLNAVIHDIEMMSETTLQEANAAIVMPNELPRITCDKTRIAEVFRNLISNAVKYNVNAAKNVEVGYRDEVATDDGVETRVFYVKDNGIGIAKEFYDDIFRLFKRLNAEDDDKKGTGVGLTFVRKIVQRHGGRIWLDSKPGEGTIFYFTIGQGAVNAEGA
jgi:signal transduction histidine kinase